MDITVDQILEEIPGSKGMIKLIADKLGCSATHVRNAINTYPVLVLAIKEEKENNFDMVEAKLLDEAMDGKPWAVKYYLDNQGQPRGYGGVNFKNGPKGFTLNVVYETPPQQLPEPTEQENKPLEIEGIAVDTTGHNDKPEETPPETSGVSKEHI